MRSAVSPSDWPSDFQRYKLVGSILNTCGGATAAQLRLAMDEGHHRGRSHHRATGEGDQFEFKPTALHIFSANRLPRCVKLERRSVVGFASCVSDTSCRPTRRDSNLADELFEMQAFALLLRAVQGMDRVR